MPKAHLDRGPLLRMDPSVNITITTCPGRNEPVTVLTVTEFC